MPALSSSKNHPKLWKWRLEWLAQTALESLVRLLPGAVVFRLGECLGGLSWYVLTSRRRVVIRNFRIAFYGQYDLPALRKMARQSFCRTGANLLSAARTAHLHPDDVRKILTIDNPEVLDRALADGNGIVMLPAHMGNWEILARMNLFFPSGHPAGSFYRPLNNPLTNARIERQRAVDGMQLFRKQDSFHLLTRFLRDGGILGVMADQRVGPQGVLMRYFGRLTRVSPLPSLLARRSKAKVLGLTLMMNGPGKWRARFHEINGPATTENCLEALERAMNFCLEDVFWFQDRFKLYVKRTRSLVDWLGDGEHGKGTPHRAVLWLAGVPGTWQIPESWRHPDVHYEVVIAQGQDFPPLDFAKIHTAPGVQTAGTLRKFLAEMDSMDPLPIDFIVTSSAPKILTSAAASEEIPVISL